MVHHSDVLRAYVYLPTLRNPFTGATRFGRIGVVFTHSFIFVPEISVINSVNKERQELRHSVDFNSAYAVQRPSESLSSGIILLAY